MDISKVTDWLQLSPKYLFPVSAIAGFLLFAAVEILDIFGLTPLVSQYRPYIGIVFLVATVLLLTHGLDVIYQWLNKKREREILVRNRKSTLHDLSNDEKKILRGYVESQTKTQYFNVASGEVGGLETMGIIYRPSNVGHFGLWAYNIQSWAWDYLNKHPELLSFDELEAGEEDN